MKAGPCWCNGQCPNEGIQQLLDEHKNGQAENQLRETLIDSPNCFRANEMLAIIMANSNRAQFAVEHIDRAAGDISFLRYCLIRAYVLRRAVRLEESADYFQRAVGLAPANPDAYAGLITVLEADGKLELAAHWCDEAKTYTDTKAHAELRSAIAAVLARQHKFSSLAVDELAGNGLLPIQLFDRGRYKEKIGDFTGAWSDWMEAKQLLRDRGRHHFKRGELERLIGESVELTTTFRLRMIAKQPISQFEPSPLFVCGFPRSGTTMLEQVLCSHSKICAGDELQFIPDLARMAPNILKSRSPYPRALNALAIADNLAAADMMRIYYMGNVAAKLGTHNLAGALFHTDKMPLNEVHLPLINILFPQAPVIYLRRHPLDIIVSSMSHFITHGWNYAASVESAAEAYVMVDALLQHYRKRFPDRIHEVRYESFVADPAGTTSRLLERLGLIDEIACHRFHETPRRSRTISYAQIQEPAYTRSVGRYKNFLQQLGSVIDQVKPICDREGYEI